MAIVKLDSTNHEEAQDMIRLIQKEKKLSEIAAIEISLNSKIFDRIIDTGWGSIALPLWGHGDYQRKWLTLDNPIIEIDIAKNNLEMIHKIETEENVDIETAVSYFLLFTMESLDYHI